jgi:hypothetical protein
MVETDWAWLLGRWGVQTDLSDFTAALHAIGLVGFILGTFLAVWSGWRYIFQYKGVVFSEADT